MGRAPCCDKANVKKGPWSPEEDAQLKGYIDKYGTGGNWISLPQRAGLRRCGKSCRLRWLNYLRPNIKHGEFSEDEDKLICTLFASIGSRWSIIAAQLPGRTDNDIKNYWNTKLKKKLMGVLSQMQPLPPQGLSSSSQPTSTYKNTSTTTHHLQTKSLPFLEPISVPSNLSLEGLVPPTPMHKDSVLPMYGGEPSCSPCDGICNQIGLERYYCNGVEENQKFMVGGQNRNGFWGETGLEYDIEEIKRLVSTNDSNNLFSEETKPQGRVMYF